MQEEWVKMALVPCIAVSLGYILLNCFLAEALRKVIGSVFQEGLLRTALNEALAAAELCACGFELIIGKLKPLSFKVASTRNK